MKGFITDIVSEYRGILHDFRFSYKRFLKYQLATKILISIILLPLYKIILGFIMKSKGVSSISNALLLKYIISPQGILSLLIIILISTSVILIEIGGLIIISHQAYTREEESSFYTILKISLTRFKNLMGTGGLLILIYLLVIAPWLQIGYENSLISSIEIPGFIEDYINESTLLSVIHLIVFILLSVVSILWIFSLHIIMLENKPAIKALNISSKIIKRNFKKFIGYILGVAFLLVLVGVLILAIFVIIGIGILSIVNIESNIGAVALGGVIVVIGLYVGVVSFFLLPLEIHHFTRLYYKLSGTTAVPLRLKVKKNKVTLLGKMISNKLLMSIVFIVVFIAASLITTFVLKDMENIKYNVRITAHRGSSKEAPENTLAALDVAIKNGADFTEIDVQETKDGNIVLLHDTNLKRTTGMDKEIWELTLEEIKQLDAGSWFDNSFKGEKVPTLQEVIDHTKGKIRLNIEIKGNGHEKNLVPSVLRIIKDNSLVDSCVVTSLNYDLLQEVESLNPRIKTGYIMFVALGDLKDLNVDFYSVEETNVTENFVSKAHLLGREVHVWTINKKSDMENMMDLGVDNIITDYEKVLKDLIEELNTDWW